MATGTTRTRGPWLGGVTAIALILAMATVTIPLVAFWIVVALLAFRAIVVPGDRLPAAARGR